MRLCPAHSSAGPGQATHAGLSPAFGLRAAATVVAKSDASRALLEAIREVAGAPSRLPSIMPRMKTEAAARLDSADHAILAMRLAGDSPADIGATLGRAVPAITDRIAAIVATLAPMASERPTRSSPRGRFAARRDLVPAWSSG